MMFIFSLRLLSSHGLVLRIDRVPVPLHRHHLQLRSFRCSFQLVRRCIRRRTARTLRTLALLVHSVTAPRTDFSEWLFWSGLSECSSLALWTFHGQSSASSVFSASFRYATMLKSSWSIEFGSYIITRCRRGRQLCSLAGRSGLARDQGAVGTSPGRCQRWLARARPCRH